MNTDPYKRLAKEFDGWAQSGRGESMENGHSDVTKQLLDHLPQGLYQQECCVLDVGCGNGWLVRELISRGATFGLGIDISADMIDVARKYIQSNRIGTDDLIQNLQQRGTNLDSVEMYLVSNGEQIECPSGSFDVITNVESLYYYPDPQMALDEWFRLAKSQGYLVIMMDLYEESPATHNWIEVLDVPVHLFSKKVIEEMLSKSVLWSKLPSQIKSEIFDHVQDGHA